MARKFDLISELYERTCFAVTDNPVNWQSFLKTAGRNFRLRFDEQLLIYAQRPDATAVLEIERWNGTFGRWVNRGAKGIAVFEDADRSRQRLIHYDTGVTAKYGDKLLTLSTCEYSRTNGRLVVVAKLINE